MYEPWVCSHKEKGYIISAHAKLGKPQTIDEIDFSKPKQKVLKKQKKPAVDSDEDDLDVSSVFRKLRQIHTSACVLLKDDSETDSASEDDDLPPRCWNLEDSLQGNVDNNYSLLIRDFTVTELQTQYLEVMTRGQYESPVWNRLRQGRITTSFVHAVKTLKCHTSSTSIVNKILKIDEKNLKNVEEVKLGLTNETVAKKQYEENMEPMHDNFCIRESGLVVDTTGPFVAATPNGVRDCTCHGTELVEIKCIYKHKDKKISDIVDNSFCLEKDNLCLKRGHGYLSQVQFQMYVCKKAFCDFVVLTDKGKHIQTILYDSDFVKDLIEKCHSLVKNDLLNEIVQQKLL